MFSGKAQIPDHIAGPSSMRKPLCFSFLTACQLRERDAVSGDRLKRARLIVLQSMRESGLMFSHAADSERDPQYQLAVLPRIFPCLELDGERCRRIGSTSTASPMIAVAESGAGQRN